MDPCHCLLLQSSFQTWSWHVQNCLQFQHVCTTIVGSFSFRLNLSDCLPSVLLSLPTSLLSFSPHPWSGWRQQKQVGDMVDYAGLHHPGRAGGGALSLTASPASSSSLLPHQVYTVSHSLYLTTGNQTSPTFSKNKTYFVSVTFWLCLYTSERHLSLGCLSVQFLHRWHLRTPDQSWISIC